MSAYPMTEIEAIEWVQAQDENDRLDEDDLEAAFAAIYERLPDDQDREDGLWSLLCAAGFSDGWLGAEDVSS